MQQCCSLYLIPLMWYKECNKTTRFLLTITTLFHFSEDNSENIKDCERKNIFGFKYFYACVASRHRHAEVLTTAGLYGLAKIISGGKATVIVAVISVLQGPSFSFK